MDSRIAISEDKKKEMTSLIQEYFISERDQDLGELAASLILDFFIKELAPDFYNQGIIDSQKFMSEKVEDILGIQIYKR